MNFHQSKVTDSQFKTGISKYNIYDNMLLYYSLFLILNIVSSLISSGPGTSDNPPFVVFENPLHFTKESV